MPIFHHSQTEWKVYKCRIEQFFLAVDITEGKKKCSTLLSFMSEKTYELIHSICHPKVPGEHTYDELCKILDTHLATAYIVYYERKVFYEARREDGETVQEWMVRLRAMAMKCKFGDKLEFVLKDKFVTGMSGKTFERLCEENESELTMEKACAVAKTYELRKMKVSGSSEIDFVRTGQKFTQCKHCGYNNHQEIRCRFKNFKCHKCHVEGHIARTCRAEKGGDSQKVVSEVKIQHIDSCEESQNSSLKVILKVGNSLIKFHIDTGSPVSVIPQVVFNKYFNVCELGKSDFQATGFGGHSLSVVGSFKVDVEYNGVIKKFEFIVIGGNAKTSILGIDFLKSFGINRLKIDINRIDLISFDKEIYNKYATVFDGNIGHLKNVQACLPIKAEPIPRFLKARPVPYAYRNEIEKQIKKLECEGIITKVDETKWGTPLVPILKSDGSIRICADYKVTVNKFLADTNYPLPKIKDIMEKLRGKCIFTKLDLAKAYYQIELDEYSRKLVTWSTHIGNYNMNRLPYGVKPASGIFQREIERVLEGLNGVVCFVDDVVIATMELNEHVKLVNEVMNRFKNAGLKLNKNKCLFGKGEIDYLGHRIGEKGVRKLYNNEAIKEAPVPKDVSEVRAFCGLVNYYSKFIKDFATIMHPIYKLLKAKVPWEWGQDCQDAYNKIKKELLSDQILVHYDEACPLYMICDASNVGIGAVLAHTDEEGMWKPIEFVSRTLTDAEKKYSTTAKEALAIIHGSKKFFQYIVGRHFYLLTDHKPLLGVFGEEKNLPEMVDVKYQRWAEHMTTFNYTMKYVESKKNIADYVSRLPIHNTDEDILQSEKEKNIIGLIQEAIPIDMDEVRRELENDEILQEVIKEINSIKRGHLVKKGVNWFTQNKEEFALENGILMRGMRVVMPKGLITKILQQVHTTHMGIVKTKNLLRSYAWWPRMNQQIEEFIKSCDACLAMSPNPPKVHNIPWKQPSRVFGRIHLDYAGPIKNMMLLIVVDAKSKWVEVFSTRNATSSFTIAKLCDLITRFGIPDEIVSDNGSQFTSMEFKNFISKYRIKQSLTAPGYPATNGAAENAVKTIKNAINKVFFENPEADLDMVIRNFLFDYRNVQHAVTNKRPAEVMLGFKPKVKLDLMRPTETPKEKNSESNKKEIGREFKEGDKVNIRSYKNPNKEEWENAEVVRRLGVRLYVCRFDSNNRYIKRHINQMRSRFVRTEATVNSGVISGDYSNKMVVKEKPKIENRSEAVNVTVSRVKQNSKNVESNQNNVISGEDNAEILINDSLRDYDETFVSSSNVNTKDTSGQGSREVADNGAGSSIGISESLRPRNILKKPVRYVD